MSNLANRNLDIKIHFQRSLTWVSSMDHTTSQRETILKKHFSNSYLTLEWMFIPLSFRETRLKTLFATYHSQTETRSRLLPELTLILLSGLTRKTQKFTSLFREPQK